MLQLNLIGAPFTPSLTARFQIYRLAASDGTEFSLLCQLSYFVVTHLQQCEHCRRRVEEVRCLLKPIYVQSPPKWDTDFDGKP